MTLQDSLPYRTRVCLERRAAARRRSRVDPGRPPAMTSTPPTGGAVTTVSDGGGIELERRQWDRSRSSARQGKGAGKVVARRWTRVLMWWAMKRQTEGKAGALREGAHQDGTR